ncbi:unnamed protein product [Arabidopsis arenosa]|uniref:chloroplast protein-transporting ATPase n=1 Tax=Arabidopsis arenosa TaxID=38785 RepID=A0A8S1ZVY0_ARAAE|nr:unnamed protein product [Arabidopsis arenosa]
MLGDDHMRIRNSHTASQFVIADGIFLRQNRLLSSSSFWGTKFGNTVRLGVSGCSSCYRRRTTSVNASLGGLLSGIFKGSDNGESTRQQYASIVSSVNRLETEISALSDSELRGRTDALKQRAQKGESMDSLLPEAFAVVREASKRVLGLRPFDVQLIGGMVLHKGEIAEMRIGEGKTLVANLPAYLIALSGKGVHVVIVNDYLARRDCEWVGQVPRFLGLKMRRAFCYFGTFPLLLTKRCMRQQQQPPGAGLDDPINLHILWKKSFSFAVRDSLVNVGPVKDFAYGLRINADANATGISKQSKYELSWEEVEGRA